MNTDTVSQFTCDRFLAKPDTSDDYRFAPDNSKNGVGTDDIELWEYQTGTTWAEYTFTDGVKGATGVVVGAAGAALLSLLSF